MDTLMKSARKLAKDRARDLLALLLFSAFAAPALAATTIGLSSDPLFGTRTPHPNVVVALSVEFPTVGRAYNQDQTGKFIPYDKTKSYLGYFDSTKCYRYSDSTPATTSPATVQASSDYFFPVSSAAADHSCSGLFSGNYMNWATMSAIDELRMALTGGDRDVDLGPGSGSPKTVLLRAFLPDGSVSGVGTSKGFYNTDTNDINWPLSETSTSASTTGSNARVAPSTVTPFSDARVFSAGCRNLVFFSTSISGGSSCSSPSANKGIYRVAVQVCEGTSASSEGATRQELCQLYTPASGAIYKPVGQVQRNAANIRFAVFGYLMDMNTGVVPSGCNGSGWNRCRYGGVLRNKMKYVGAQTFDSALNPTANANREINDDGTFVINPDANAIVTGGYSGFINYINKFGSTGLYKRYDPAGEMYYEALRYLAKQPASPAATNGMTTAMQDGFPVVKFFESPPGGTLEDPLLNSCQANYILNVSDSNTNDDMFLPGWSTSPSDSFRPPKPGTFSTLPTDAMGFNAITWTNKVGALESPAIANLASQPMSSGSYFIAGAAYWANTNDIRSDLAGKQTVKTIAFDVGEIISSPWDNVKRRALYYAGKYGGFNDVNNDGDPKTTIDTAGATVTNNSEWEDAPGSSSASNFILASDPLKLIKGLDKAFAGITKSIGTTSGFALSKTSIVSGGAGAYTALFNAYKWSGTVILRNLTFTGSGATGALTVSPPVWDAATRLDAFIGTAPASIPANAAQRMIFTMNSANTGIAFDWASVSADTSSLIGSTGPTYADYLNTDPKFGVADGLGANRVKYLRGDRVTDEDPNGQEFRARSSAFGDVINSGPVYVGGPSTSISDANYPTFYAANKSRPPAVYVGANDGMLHALKASTGDELFAYIPRAVANKLNRLTNPGYIHTSYVDAVPEVVEAKLGLTWKTVLVSGLGAGGQGVFALDVSNPANFSVSVASKVLWEFTDADDVDFGNVVGKPLIVKINTAAPASTPSYRWFAIVTGYNSLQADSFVGTDQRGTIFLLALDKVASAAWVLGANYYKIKTPYDSTVADTTKPNGLSPVAYLPNRNGRGDAVTLYAGDLQGNLWKIDLTKGASTWTGTGAVMFSATPLFTAKDSSGGRQPITDRPALAKGPANGTMVLFGTGQYLGTADLTTNAQQSFYGIFDNGGTSTAAQVGSRSTDLAVRTLTSTAGVVSVTGSTFTFSSSVSAVPGSKDGWYVDFPNTATTGERSVSGAVVDSGIVTFSTITLSADPCGSGGGFIYQMSAVGGLALDISGIVGGISNVGIPGPAQSVQLSSTSPAATQNTGETVFKKEYGAIVTGTSGDIKLTDKRAIVRLVKGRVGWREIPNWSGLANP